MLGVPVPRALLVLGRYLASVRRALLLVMPALAVLYGVFGSVVVAIGGALYNLAARWVGGIGLDLEMNEPSPGPPSTPVS